MAKKKKNIKPAKVSGVDKKSASQNKAGEKKSSVKSQKKSPEKKAKTVTKPESKKSSSPKKKTPVKSKKVQARNKTKSPKEKKEIIGGGGNTPQKEKKGAGFSSNNFNYIRSLIWKEYGLDYVSYFDPKFINIVKAVYNECKSAGAECSDREILLFYDDILVNPKRDFPYIDEDLYTDAIPYYQLLDVEFNLFPAYLWVVSEMIMPPPSEFIITSYVNSKDGSADKGYRKYFKEFVDWCNEAMRNSYGSEVSSDDIDIFVKFSKPEFKEEKQRWETEIIICNADGESESFGFVPKGRMSDHDVDDEFEKPIEGEEQDEKDIIAKEEEITITPEEAKRLKENNEKLFSLLLKMKKKKEQLDRKEKSKVKKKIAVKRTKVDVQKNKNAELKRLKEIKKELEKAILLYKKIADKKRMNKSLKDLDAVMAKIKKLT